MDTHRYRMKNDYITTNYMYKAKSVFFFIFIYRICYNHSSALLFGPELIEWREINDSSFEMADFKLHSICKYCNNLNHQNSKTVLASRLE